MKIFILKALFFCVFLSFALPAFSATAPADGVNVTLIPPGAVYKKLISMKPRDIQKMTGKKMSLKEKVAFGILKVKLKKQYNNKSSQGQTALIFGIAGLALFVVGLFVPYVILGALIAAIVAIVVGSSAKKKNPDDTKAHAGKLLGWITLGLIALLLVLAAIVAAAWV